MLFVLLLAAPTLLSVLDKGTDISMFYSFAEEENTHEPFQVIEIDFKNCQDQIVAFGLLESKKVFNCYLNMYTQSILEHVSPPPELNS